MKRAPIKTDLSPEQVRAIFNYDPETGIVSHKPRKGIRRLTRAGCVNSGYRRLKVNTVPYLEHRIIWLMMTSGWPPIAMDIDHVNGDKTDNRWCNLRLATRTQNCLNGPRRNKNKKKGAYLTRDGKFVAKIMVDGVEQYLGRHFTEDQAHAAYMEAAQQAVGAFARAK